MLSFFGRPSKVAKQGATSKLPVFSFRKLVGDADVNIFGSVSTANGSSVVTAATVAGASVAASVAGTSVPNASLKSPKLSSPKPE